MSTHHIASWELSWMLDELWLSARRNVIHQLVGSGQWVLDPEFHRTLRYERQVGKRLSAELLPDALGRMDAECVQSEQFMRAGNARFRTKLPLMLAFGYNLGVRLAQLAGSDGESARRASVACALFNLGISLLDSIFDQLPDLRATFNRCFNSALLVRLASESRSGGALRKDAESLSDVELRVLLKIIAVFFQLFHELNYSTGTDAARSLCVLHLQNAYQAQLSSTTALPADIDDARSAAKAKSTTPFLIMGELCSLSAGVPDGRRHRLLGELALELGEVFCLTDDLADVSADLMSKSVNTVLLDVGITPTSDDISVYAAIADLLNSRRVERYAKAVVSRLQRVEELLASFGAPDAATELRALSLFYVRSWIT